MKQPNFESIEDSFIDVAGYAIIGLLLLKNQWQESLFTDDTPVQDILSELNDIFNRKMRDYGLGDMQEGGTAAVLSRLTDKISRLKNLTGAHLSAKANTPMSLLYTQTGDYPISAPQKPGDCGFDLYVAEDVLLPANLGMPVDVPSHVSVKLPENTWGLIINRSSTARKYGLDVVPGVIDCGFTGELFACVWNRTGRDIRLTAGTRLAQLIVLPLLVPQLEHTTVLPQTERGTAGFGSTGK